MNVLDEDMVVVLLHSLVAEHLRGLDGTGRGRGSECHAS